MEQDNTERFYSPPALARLLGVAEATVYRWIREGRIPAPSITLGGARGYESSAVSEIQSWHRERSYDTPKEPHSEPPFLLAEEDDV